MSPYIGNVQSKYIYRDRKQIGGCHRQGRGEEGGAEWLLMGVGFLLRMIKMFQDHRSAYCTIL